MNKNKELGFYKVVKYLTNRQLGFLLKIPNWLGGEGRNMQW